MINGYFNHQHALGIEVVSKFGFGIAIIWFSRWTIGFMVDMFELLNRVSQITYNWGAPHCIIVTFVIIKSKTWIYFGKAGKGDISITSSMIIAVIIIYS